MMVSVLRSPAVSVTLRKRSDCVPTRPATHVSWPINRTVSTRIGSLKSGFFRIWPIAMGVLVFIRQWHSRRAISWAGHWAEYDLVPGDTTLSRLSLCSSQLWCNASDAEVS